MKSIPWTCVFLLLLAVTLFAAKPARAQDASADPTASESPIDYPREAGVLIQAADWTPVANVFPAKMRVKNGVAAAFTYSAVRAVNEADYEGEHAAVQVDPGRPVLCVCHFSSIPGDPVIVKLHAQKGMRELDGGKLTPFKGKVAQASQSDLVPADVSHPESMVWLVRPQQALAPGEYALMLGTQNMAIFPFTVLGNPAEPGDAKH